MPGAVRQLNDSETVHKYKEQVRLEKGHTGAAHSGAEQEPSKAINSSW